MGEVYLLQDDHGVPYMTVKEMHSESWPHHCPPYTPLDGAVPHSHHARERHPMSPWIVWWGEGLPLISRSHNYANYVLCLPVDRQQPLCQVHATNFYNVCVFMFLECHISYCSMNGYLVIPGCWYFYPPWAVSCSLFDSLDALGLSNRANSRDTNSDVGDKIIHAYVQLQLIQLKHQRQRFNKHMKQRIKECTKHPMNKKYIVTSLVTQGARNFYN